MPPIKMKSTSAALTLSALAFTPMHCVYGSKGKGVHGHGHGHGYLSGTGFNYNADHLEDSRLIAYVANWEACPTDDQVDAYSHIVIAFAKSYTWAEVKNICNQECQQVPSSLPTCGNQARPDLIEKWRSMGKKVIVSFGGAGMGGSWPGDKNNCWDYCFGREDKLSTDLVNIVKDQNLDGIDIDYEYCYDVAGKQAGSCAQRSSLYSDEKAQRFLNSMTSLLRTKLDNLQARNGYNRGRRYELTHAPRDFDLVTTNGHATKYFDILHERRADLDFLMTQFYNGITRAGIYGFDGTGDGFIEASTVYSLLANKLFDREPNKIVFGHCISDCSDASSKVNANQAVQIQKEIKEYNNGEFACNGGAFFWVANHDVGGAWSDQVVSEVSLTAGCSKFHPPTTPRPTSRPSPSGTCGNGDRGNGVCADGTCCSKWGWCGTSTEHCSGGPTRNPTPPPTTSPDLWGPYEIWQSLPGGKENDYRCIDLKHSKTFNGNDVWYYPCNQTPAQRWYWDVSNNYIRSSIDKNKCLVGANGSSERYTKLIIYDCFDNDDRFRWDWVASDDSLRPRNNKDVCIEAWDGDSYDLILDNCHDDWKSFYWWKISGSGNLRSSTKSKLVPEPET